MLTPVGRVSYEHVFTPQMNDLSKELEYSIVLIFDPDADLSPLKEAMVKVMSEKFGTDASKWPQNFRKPFRKCKERWKEDGSIPPGYENGEATFVTFKAKAARGKPGVVDQNVQPIIDPNEFYSGCYAIVSANPYWYDQKGNKGISFGLNNVQKVKDGDPLGGRSSPTADFKPVAGASKSAAASVFDD